MTFQAFFASAGFNLDMVARVAKFERETRVILKMFPERKNSQELKTLLKKFEQQIRVLHNVQGCYQLQDDANFEGASLLKEICDMENSESLENSNRMYQFLKNAIDVKTLSAQCDRLLCSIQMQIFS